MNAHRKYLWILTLSFLLCTATTGAEVSIIELKHRRAEEVIRIVAPLLGSTDAISGKGFTVIVTAAAENISRIESIVRSLDRPSRQLLITVVQGENARQALNTIDVSGNLSVGDQAGVEFGRHPQPDDTVSVKGRSDKSAQRNADIQRLRVREGMRAVMFIGQAIPVSTATIDPRTGSRVVFQQVRTGFDVVARLSGNRFVLDIVSQRESTITADRGAIATQQIQTQVSGQLGQWVDVGGILGMRQFGETGFVYSDEYWKENRSSVFLTIVEVAQ